MPNKSTSVVGMYVCMAITYSKIMDQPGEVANLTRSELNRTVLCCPVPVPVENLVSRDRFGGPVCP